jgi:hypothetical protein
MANVKRITQNIGLREAVSIDKRILLPLLWSRDHFISENIGKKRISPAESGDLHEVPDRSLLYSDTLQGGSC